MKNIVITGANRGIGLALVKLYRGRGEQVVATCRKASADLAGTGATVVEGIDVSDGDAGRLLREALAGMRVDTLINNAGIFVDEQLGKIHYGDIAKQLEVNAIGPLRITEALLDNLTDGSKIAFITSRMGSIADNTSGGYFGYRMSKAALNAAAMSLTKALVKKGVAVAILHPGFVQTEMVGFAGNVTAEVAANGLATRLDQLNMGNTGTFWHANGEVLPW